MTEQKLNQLFESARNAEVQTSQEEVTRWLATAAVAAVTVGAAASGFKLLITKNMIAMIVGTLSVTGIAVVSTVIFSAADPGQPVSENSAVLSYTDSTENNAPEEVSPFQTYSTDYKILPDDNATRNRCASLNEDSLRSMIFDVAEKPIDTETPVAPVAPVPGYTFIPFNPELRDTVKTGSYELAVSSFSRLRIDGVFDVIINQGDKEKVVVESNFQDVVGAELDGETLVLTSRDSRNSSHCKDVYTTVVYVTVKNLTELELFGVGNVNVEGLKASNLLIKFDCVGDLTMDMLFCDHLELMATGVGDVYLSGSSMAATYTYDGVGDVRAYEFKVHKVHVVSSGVGNMYIYADESLVIDADGIGDIKYTGNPDVKKLTFAGVGTLQSDTDKEEKEDKEDKGGKPADRDEEE